MRSHKTIGEYYARQLEEQLNRAIQQKLDAASAFKKSLAGIHSVEDAKRKGYAPDDHQIGQIKACIRLHADSHYEQAHFRALPLQTAVQELVRILGRDIGAINERWKQERKFTFDSAALLEIAQEAASLLLSEHEPAIKHYY